MSSSAAAQEAATFFHTYKRLPLEVERGEGVYIYSKDGKRYLDMFGGIAVNALGHGHPGVLEAIQKQTHRYIHLSNYFIMESQLTLAALLVKHTGYSRVFFSNSGTEAIEGCIKLARKWGHGVAGGRQSGKTDIVAFSDSFHGRTMGALSLMDRPNYLEGFEPFLEHCKVVEFNNVKALEGAVNEKTAAVFLEFIQGESGVRPATQEFVAALKSLQSRFGFLLVADEVQAGLGRTGKFFGFQHFDVHPDIVAVAKPLGGGLPLGAILGGLKVAEVLTPGSHGTTFGGNPVACAAGIVVIKEIIHNGVMDNARLIGDLLRISLAKLKNEFPSIIKEVRGYGLMIGVELSRDVEPVVAALRDRGVLVNGTAKTVLRFVPPLTIKKEHVEETVETLRNVLNEHGDRVTGDK